MVEGARRDVRKAAGEVAAGRRCALGQLELPQAQAQAQLQRQRHAPRAAPRACECRAAAHRAARDRYTRVPELLLALLAEFFFQRHTCRRQLGGAARALDGSGAALRCAALRSADSRGFSKHAHAGRSLAKALAVDRWSGRLLASLLAQLVTWCRTRAKVTCGLRHTTKLRSFSALEFVKYY